MTDAGNTEYRPDGGTAANGSENSAPPHFRRGGAGVRFARKGTATGKSDLDMVAFGSVEKQILPLRECFDESSLPFRVDIFAWNQIPEQFRENIGQKYYVVQGGKD